MRFTIYFISFATNLLCSFLLLRAYRTALKRLLLWSGLCFAGLALGSVMICFDALLVPHVDLFLVRLVVADAAMALLIYGLIFDQP